MKKTPQAVMEEEVPKPDKSMMMASVTLPPPPARQTAPVEETLSPKKAKQPAPKPVAKVVPMKPLPATKITPMVAKILPSNISPTGMAENGRALLRLLEYGKGPSITISWPAGETAMSRLYQTFTNCFGMKTALMDFENKLYTIDSPIRKTWRPNLDKFSSFMRRPSGGMAREELRHLQNIRNRHGMMGGIPIRLFPRNVDAVLLAGLKKHLNDEYEQNTSIQAAYHLTGKDVTVSEIQINGSYKSGIIKMPSPRRCYF
jgi:hypothetical protein